MARELVPDDIYIAHGSTDIDLAQAIATEVGVGLGPMELRTHPNGELYGRFSGNIRSRDVFLVQSHVRSGDMSPNDALVEQMLLAGAARSSGAHSITAVCPYLGYTRQDRKDRGRDPIGIQMAIDSLTVNGVDQIITVDMHASQSGGIMRGPFDNITVQPELRREVIAGLEERGYGRDSWLIVAADEGALKMNKNHAKRMGNVRTVFIPKDRPPENPQQPIRDVLGFDPDGLVCAIFDDMIDTAGTVISAAEELRKAGAVAVHLAATHNVLSDPALSRLQDAFSGDDPLIERFVVSDTHPAGRAIKALGDKITVVSCAPIVGKTIVANLTGGSVSELLDGENYS